MLQKSFCHLKGITIKKEQKIWKLGLTSWHELLEKIDEISFLKDNELLKNQLEDSIFYYEKGLVRNFHKMFPVAETWRLYNNFKHKTAFLDIETNGLSSYSYITTVSVANSQTPEIKTFIRNINLSELIDYLEEFDVLVTFNGNTFDLPIIERIFQHKLTHFCIDLRYVLASLGFKGGLKSIEKQLGINRNELDGVDGAMAVELWNQYYYSGRQDALELLVRYNQADTYNMIELLDLACELKKELYEEYFP